MGNQMLEVITKEILDSERENLRSFNQRNSKENKLDELYKEYINNDLSFEDIELLRRYNEYLKKNI
ncbi:TPA: hypothetical protein ACF2DD_002185 [Clostridium perfringens]|uniref:hypothetical protein n=1 Tax=Clostridium perfringens TaxID=1502 RepID=UPI00096AB766|nr:hypothetical protein [Clostridium perfringens]